MGPSCEEMEEFVKLYHARKSKTLITETMKKHHPGMKVQNEILIYRLEKKFQIKGTIHDTRHNSGSGRSKSARTRNKH
jgi:hypothetical protein